MLNKALQRGAFFIVCLLPAGAVSASCALPEVERYAEVVKVVDGDTLRLDDGESVRLIGINTPELGHDVRPDDPGAVQAWQYLRRWTDGRELGVVRGIEPRDRYGRLLAHLSLHGESVSERLLSQGLGFAIAIPPDLRLSDCLFAAERRARDRRLGLWQGDPVRSAESIRNGGFALVAGRVTKIDKTRRALYLELDDHLVLRIGRQLVEPEIERFVREFEGRQVEARGWVVDRGTRLKPGRKRWFIGISDLRHLGRRSN